MFKSRGNAAAAAKIPRAETRYYKECLQPLVEQIKLVGELKDDAKGDLLRSASALLQLVRS